MNNAEQQQRLREIQEQQEYHSKQFDGHGHHFGRADIRKILNSVDFLLSIVKSQEAGGDNDSSVDAIMRGLETRLLDHADSAIDRAIDAAAASMRSACVEKVKAMAEEWQMLWEKDLTGDEADKIIYVQAANHIIIALESITLQDHETKQTPQAGKTAP